MNITTAMILFLSLLLCSWAVLEYAGITATLFVSCFLFLMGLILKRRLTKKQAIAEVEIINLNELPEMFRNKTGIKQIREDLNKFKFKYYKSFIFENINRYFEIYAVEDIFCEIVIDEEHDAPKLILHTYFNNDYNISSESGDKPDYENVLTEKTEYHWFPDLEIVQMINFHRRRVQFLKNEGFNVQTQNVVNFSEERIKNHENTINKNSSEA